MKSLSIVGRDYHTEEQVVGYYNQGDRRKAWGKRGAFWGGLWGAIFGSSFFFIPGLWPLVLPGPLVSWLVGGRGGPVVAGALSGASWLRRCGTGPAPGGRGGNPGSLGAALPPGEFDARSPSRPRGQSSAVGSQPRPSMPRHSGRWIG